MVPLPYVKFCSTLHGPTSTPRVIVRASLYTYGGWIFQRPHLGHIGWHICVSLLLVVVKPCETPSYYFIWLVYLNGALDSYNHI